MYKSTAQRMMQGASNIFEAPKQKFLNFAVRLTKKNHPAFAESLNHISLL